LPRFSPFLYWVNFLPKIWCFDGELPIFIWGTAPGGDEAIWAIKRFSGQMQI
jgi:hypothetical protein